MIFLLNNSGTIFMVFSNRGLFYSEKPLTECFTYNNYLLLEMFDSRLVGLWFEAHTLKIFNFYQYIS